MREYYSSFPFSETNQVSKSQFETLNNGFIVFDDDITKGKIIEKIVNGRVEFVSFLTGFDEEKIIFQIVNEKYGGIDYEIEKKLTQATSLILRKQNTIIIRRYDPSSGFIISEATFQDGELLQYDEITYNSKNELSETRTFIGRNAWAVEKEYYK
jgi:hypothetical protein